MTFRQRRARLGLLAAVLALSQLSCASSGLTPMKQSMPVARAALRPEYRFFYDTLGDYGEWVLIEPYGYVFRPTVYFDSWRPYGNGFWVPTDLYGWVWVSAEPFGWATYHYGQWLYDAYQRWVWIPGLEWAPARVAWEATDDWVGWTPLMPYGASSSIPGGAYTYVRTGDLAATDLKDKTMREQDLGNLVAAARPIENLAKTEGKTFNRGPSLQWVERSAGPLRKARIDDLIPPRPSGDDPGAGATPSRAPQTPPGVAPPDSLATTRAAAERAASAARSVVESGAMAPDRLPVVRPFGVPVVEEPKTRPPASRRAPTKKQVAKPDSTR